MNIYEHAVQSKFISHVYGLFQVLVTCQLLREQNKQFKGTGGRSQENRSVGFVPAFQDTRTGATYRSRFANGHCAPVHVLGGLPAEFFMKVSDSASDVVLNDAIEAGFLRDDQFYTRREAADYTNKHQAVAN
jgi:hypothetical protein